MLQWIADRGAHALAEISWSADLKVLPSVGFNLSVRVPKGPHQENRETDRMVLELNLCACGGLSPGDYTLALVFGVTEVDPVEFRKPGV